MSRMSSAVLALALLAWSAPARAQDERVKVLPEQREDAAMALREYRALVESYKAGNRTAPRTVLEWTPKRLAIAQGLIRIGKSRDRSTSAEEPSWDAPLVRAAALLHTEAAFLRFASLDPGELNTHLAVASRLLERGAPETNAFARRWYLAVARVLRDHVRLETAEVLLELGRKRLPGDALVLCESGTLAEAMATDRAMPRAFDPAPVPRQYNVDQFKEHRRVLLTRGARFLRDSLEAGSADVLCRLHLGRVRSLLGSDDAAEAILQDLQHDEDDAVSYLASMFLGGAVERRGRQAEAEPYYRAAIARSRRGHIAYVGLSSVLLAGGRVTEAREILAQGVNADANDRRDSWWWYHFEPSAIVDARFEALRQEGLK